MQYPHPLQTSGWSTTVSNSVRISAPVGQASRQPACVQCLQTSDMNTHDGSSPSSSSTNRTCRHVEALSSLVKSYDVPFSNAASSAGRSFHCLHATSQALHPMHTVVSVKNPMRSTSRVIARSVT